MCVRGAWHTIATAKGLGGREAILVQRVVPSALEGYYYVEVAPEVEARVVACDRMANIVSSVGEPAVVIGQWCSGILYLGWLGGGDDLWNLSYHADIAWRRLGDYRTEVALHCPQYP